MKKVDIMVLKSEEEVSEEINKLVGIEKGIKSNVNIVAFLINGGVITPEDLKDVEKDASDLINKIDTSKPVILSGRGPLWLYGVFVHNLHFVNTLATWEPRKKIGIIIEATTNSLIGKGIDIDGKVADIELGAKGMPKLVLSEIGNKSILHFEVVGDKFLEPSTLANIEYQKPNGSKPLIIEGMMPVWAGARFAVKYVHKVPAIAFYDPRIKGGVIFASHSKEYEVGKILEVKSDEIERASGIHNTKIIGIVGDPNSGKSVFLHLLNESLRSKGFITLTQEADITAPTQQWSLFEQNVRKELKKYMNTKERLEWIINSLSEAKNAKSTDYIIADIGGGKPEKGERVTKENLAILQHVDGIVIVSRNENKQINEWLKELKAYVPDIKIYGILESKLNSKAKYSNDGYGVVSDLDRDLYREGKIPEDTKNVAEKIAERIITEKYINVSASITNIKNKKVSLSN